MTALRLLILDDDPLTGRTISNIATVAGASVELTSHHSEFFAALERGQPDVIALDLVMPGMDGVEVLTELSRRHCTCKIIITSGVGSRVLDAASRTAAERGLHIIGVLPKPFTPATLRELLARCPTGETHGNLGGYTPSTAAAPPAPQPITPSELEQALANGEITLAYQPKVVCQTGVVSGFEALARWQSPRRGTINPDVFIALAEKHHLIDLLTATLFERALRWLGELRTAIRQHPVAHAAIQHPEKLSLSFNISALSLSNAAMFDRFISLCGEYGTEPQQVILELTETSAMEDPVSSMELLTRLRLRGFRLSIDDFGTGYSSMIQLAKLPFSEIKVDKSFVVSAADSEESRVIIKTIVGLGMNLGLMVTAEGIEDESTLLFLRSIGCTLAQGYYISRPLPGAAVLDWIAEQGKFTEKRRLDALYALNILDTPSDQRFDLLVRLTARLTSTSMAVFALMDGERLWLKSRHGLLVPAVSRVSAVCRTTIENDITHIVTDAQADEELQGHTLVIEAPHLRFYAGCPIHAMDGTAIGSLALLDTEPRKPDDNTIGVLQGMGALVERELYKHADDSIDQTTNLPNQHAMEAWLPELLAHCERLGLPCTLRLFELGDISASDMGSYSQRNHYTLSTFTRLLLDSFQHADLAGRFDRNKFVLLEVGDDPKPAKLAAWKLGSAVRSHNLSAPAGLDLRYAMGEAGVRAGGDYNLLSLLTRADREMPPI